MGKSTISMAIFNSYVSLPEGTRVFYVEEGLKRLEHLGSAEGFTFGAWTMQPYPLSGWGRCWTYLDIGPWGTTATVCLSMPTSIHILFSNEGFISDGGEILQTLP